MPPEVKIPPLKRQEGKSVDCYPIESIPVPVAHAIVVN
jgi:hypothetical protein